MLIIRSGARGELDDDEKGVVTTDTPGDVTPDASVDASDPVTVRAQLNGHAAKSEKAFAADVAAGRVPGVRRIQQQLHVGQPKARLVQAHLRNVIDTQ
jgi:hypothetical protein